ncbi:MAG: hypothetical protein ACKVOU_02615, partial [Cytophagales bacterium]
LASSPNIFLNPKSVNKLTYFDFIAFSSKIIKQIYTFLWFFEATVGVRCFKIQFNQRTIGVEM